MKKLINNLKPLIAYWVLVAMLFMLCRFQFENFVVIAIIFVLIISNILLGYFNNFKDMLYGLIILGLQLIISPIILSSDIPQSNPPLAGYGNLLFTGVCYPIESSFFRYLLSIALPFILILIGHGLAKVKKNKQ